MKISVVIPTYNRADYLPAAIDSVLNQTLGDVEIIVVDDGSTDATPDVVAGYGDKVRYVRTEHGGLAHARNAGIMVARGDYFSFLDSDDVYYPYALEILTGVLDRHPEVPLVYAECSAFDDNGLLERFHLKTYHSGYRRHGLTYDAIFDASATLAESGVLPPSDACREFADRRVYFGCIFETYLRNLIVFTNSMVIRREVVQQFGYLRETIAFFLELDFILRVCRRHPVAFVDVPTYQLRYHPGQMSTTAGRDGTFVSVQKQHCLLRVVRHHARREADYYAEHRNELDRHIGLLHLAVARPLLACEPAAHSSRSGYRVRARRHLSRAAQYGVPTGFLWSVSFLPSPLRRVAFAVDARLGRSR